jgi:hypothetical protein
MIHALSMAALGLVLVASSCGDPTADQQQSNAQETMQQQAIQQIGLPNIVNFREMRTLKMVEELADRSVPTYSYIFSPLKGCFVFIGPSFGYPIPYATQYTNPQKLESNVGTHYYVIDQADPNGLFKPESAAGTWILMMDPATQKLQPQYIEDNVEAFTFKLPNECKD